MSNVKEKYPYKPDYAVPPGRTLEETVEHYGIGIQELADHLGVTPERVYGILRGTVSINSEIAEQLESITRVPAQIWNTMEAAYQKQLAKSAKPFAIAEK